MTFTQSDLEADPPPVAPTQEPGGESIEGRSLGRIAWTRLKRDKVAMTSLVLVVLILLAAVAAPFLQKFGVINANRGDNAAVQGIGGLPTTGWGGISGSHWLGVEPGTGRDVFSRLLLGLPLDLVIALAGAFLTVAIGTIVGLVAGFSGRWIDAVIGRISDLVLSFPQLVMLLALSIVVIQLITDVGVPAGNPSRVFYLILVLGFFGWPAFARLVRGQALSLREREFVDAARSLGARPGRIIFRELLPNLWATILVYATSILPAYVSTEAALSYLGVGVVPPTPTIGNILSDSVNYSGVDPVYFFAPGVLLIIVVLAFNLLGDGLRDALDPKADRS